MIPPNPIRYKRNPQNTDWDLFNLLLEHSLQNCKDAPVLSPQFLDSTVEYLATSINDAYMKSCPEKPLFHKLSKPITKETLSLIKSKRKLQRDFSKTHDPRLKIQINRLKKLIKRNIKTKQIINWDHFCKSLNFKDNHFWKKIKPLIKSNNNMGKTYNQSLKQQDGTLTSDPQVKANIFADTLAKTHTTPSGSMFDNNFKFNIECFIEETKAEFEPYVTENCPVISLQEFLKALSNCSSGSAPGLDNISYLMIKNMSAQAKGFILKLYNNCIKVGYFPTLWKQAKVIMIPKPKKNLELPENYRPISLLSCIGKLFEKLLTAKIYSFLEQKRYFSEYQSGFRPHHQTSDHLLRLTQSLKISSKLKNHSVALFLDAEKAFDSCWHDGLKYKVKNSNLHPQYVRLISLFLQNRTLNVSLGGTTSKSITLQAGTPQGSCLSPLLYILYINDLPNHPLNNVNVSQFADDIALWTSSKSLAQTGSNMNHAISDIELWCSLWRVKLNPEKSNLIYFRFNKKYENNLPDIQLFGHKLQYERTAKFLGVIFDQKLNFSEHIKEICTGAQKRLNLLKLLSSKRKLDPYTGINLYKMYIRPLFEYGSIAFLTSSNTNINKLQKLQNSAIRSACYLPTYINKKILHSVAQIPTLSQRLLELNTKLLKTMVSHNLAIKELLAKYLTVSHIKKYYSPLDLLFQHLSSQTEQP